MPSKKQRRRQQKARRHDYEYVYVDDEGNEVAVDPAELRAEGDGRESRPKQAQSRKPDARKSPRRAIEPPSWRRSGKRALILGPVLIVALMLFNQDLPLSQQIAPAIFLIAFFIPFSYFTDTLAYRMYRKRLARSKAAKSG
jgi:hypothetical protein